MVKKVRSRLANTTGRRHTIYIPTDLYGDSAFPFRSKQELEVEIFGKTLVIRGV